MAELKATKQKTQHGRVVYTLNGEKVSEKSITLKMPNGSWVNVPTIHNGKIYTEFQIMDMLKNFEIMPTSRHASKKDAEAAAKARSNEIITMPAKAYDISWRNPDNKHLYDADGNRTNKLADGTDMSGAQKFAAYQTYPKEKESFDESIMKRTNDGLISTYGNYTSDVQREFAEDQNKQKTEELAAILDRVDAEKKDHIFSWGRPWLGGAKQTLDKYGESNLKYHQKQWKKREEEAKKQEEKEKKLAEREAIRAKLQWGDGADIWNSLALEREETSGLPLDQLKYPYQGQVSATDQTMFDNAKEERRLLHMGKAMSSYGPRTTPEIDTGTRKKVELSDIRSDGPLTRTGKYSSSKIVPEVVNVPKPNTYAGFQFHDAGFKKPDGTAAGYWSADEDLPFWQTDAGYEKAIQTWGEKPGWVKPGYRPKRKELDIEKIKSWFKRK